MTSRILWKGSKKISKKVGLDNHARPIPIKGRPSKTKKKKKKKKGVRGGLPSANVYARTHDAHTQKNLRSDISDSLTVNWGGEKASPSFLFRLPPNQNLKNAENLNRKKDKFSLVAHTQPEHRRLALQICYTHKMAELVRGRFTAYGGLSAGTPKGALSRR